LHRTRPHGDNIEEIDMEKEMEEEEEDGNER
jgi:hypothetical protein